MAKDISLPDGWTWTKLNNIGQFLRGVSYRKEDSVEQPKDNFVPILRATNIQDEHLILDCKLVYVPNKYVKPDQYLEPGDIVVCMSSGSKNLVGKAAQLAQMWTGSFGTFCAVIRPSPSVHAGFVGYFFSSPYYRHFIRKKSAGININNLRPSDFEVLEIPLPPLPEQERIVAKIEELFTQLDAGVAGLYRVQAALKRYKASVLKAAYEGKLVPQDSNDEPADTLLHQLEKSPLRGDNLPYLPIGWCWATIADIGANKKYAIVDGPFGSMLKVSDYVIEGNIPVITISNIDDGFDRKNLRV
jgi:type I restriction enzyme, S subunit